MSAPESPRAGALQAAHDSGLVDSMNREHIGESLWCLVRGGRPRCLQRIESLNDRGRLIMQMIDRLYARPDWRELGAPEDGDFFCNGSDRPPEDDATPVLVFSTTPESQLISIPSFAWLGWPYDRIPPVDQWAAEWLRHRDVPFADRKDVLFWRGSALGHRVETVRRVQGHPNADCAPTPPYVPMTEQTNYKYILDIMGVGWSARLVQLAWMGAVLFVCDRPWHEFWFREHFKPWVHYVPVETYGEDLAEKLDAVLRMPDKGEHIARACRELAREVMTGDYMERSLAQKLALYKQRYGMLEP